MFRRLLAVNYFFLATLLYAYVGGDELPECNNQPMKSFIAVSTNCSKAIYCDGLDSAIMDCDMENPYFSPNDELCYENSSVCGDRPFGNETILGSTASATTTTIKPVDTTTNTAATTTTLTSFTASTTTATVTISKPAINTTFSAQANTTPVATTTTIESTPNIITTISSTTTWPPSFTTSSIKTTSTTTKLSISLPCPVSDYLYKPLFLTHPKSCSHYYLCYYGKAIEMQCAANLYFDVTQQACNKADRVNCQVKSLTPREQCLSHIVDVYPHPLNCNYYYLCEYGFLMVMQCPFNMLWDYEKRICALRSTVKCYKTF